MAESTIRKYRIDDETYEAAGTRAASEGTDVSKLIRQWMTDYAAGLDALAYRPQATPGSLLDQIAELVEQLRAEVAASKAPRAPRAPVLDPAAELDAKGIAKQFGKATTKRAAPARKRTTAV